MTKFYDIASGAIVAICLPWSHSSSGCVEWRLDSWTLPDDAGQCLPILDDGHDEDHAAWGSDYAVWDPQGEEWQFPDGERCADENLRAAFARRMGRQ